MRETIEDDDTRKRKSNFFQGQFEIFSNESETILVFNVSYSPTSPLVRAQFKFTQEDRSLLREEAIAPNWNFRCFHS